MPVQYRKDRFGCFARWGERGAKYYYKCGSTIAQGHAKEKALKQAAAIGFSDEKISFDYDDTLTEKAMQDLTKKLIESGTDVYVISARRDVDGMLDLTKELGITDDHVYAMGSNPAKIEKIKELSITLHYDNNPDVIKKLGSTGKLFKLSAQEIHIKLNDNRRIK